MMEVFIMGYFCFLFVQELPIVIVSVSVIVSEADYYNKG